MARVGMGLIKNEHGVYVVRRKVPPRLEEAVAQLLGRSKARQPWLQKSTGSKVEREARRIAVDILVSFDRTISEAEALIAERPLRTALSQAEIDRIAEFWFAESLTRDDELTLDGGADDDEFVRGVAAQLDQESIPYETPVPLAAQRPQYGLSDRMVAKRNGNVAFLLPIIREALSRGDVSKAGEALEECLDRFQINLDRDSVSYRKLGVAILKAEVRALEALERRTQGEVIETPPISHLEPMARRGQSWLSGDTGLMNAFVGWKMERERSDSSLRQYERVCTLFIQFHGNLPIGHITRDHARRFREALQGLPGKPTREHMKITMPDLIEWRREHPDEPRMTNASVNKYIGGLQAVLNWARDKGMITDGVWANPFEKMKLEEDDPQGGPFEPEELRRFFALPVFVEADTNSTANLADYWLPLLALFTGARKGELAKLRAKDVARDDATGCYMLSITEDKQEGKSLKTASSWRTVPVHPELTRLGFLDVVEAAKVRGDPDWLLPTVSTARGLGTWGERFGRTLEKLGIGDRKAMHSFRHCFKDALRAAGVSEDLSDALTGHGGGGVGRRYGARPGHAKQRHKQIVHRFGTPRMVSAVEAVNYSGIDLPVMRTSGPAANRSPGAKRKTKATA